MWCILATGTGGAELITRIEEDRGETFRIEIWPEEQRAKVTDRFGEFATIRLKDDAWLGEYKSEKYHADLGWQSVRFSEVVGLIEQALVSIRPPALKSDEAEKQMREYADSLKD